MKDKHFPIEWKENKEQTFISKLEDSHL